MARKKGVDFESIKTEGVYEQAATAMDEPEKAAKLRMMMAFSEENTEMIRTLSRAKNMNMTQFVNSVLDEYRAANADLISAARAFLEQFGK